MNPYEIYIAYISWGVNGKYRPILFIEEDGGYAMAFRVTSQYANKSDDIKAQYIEITDWQHAGLSKLSYIDAGEKVKIALALISPNLPIGKLSEADKQRLLEFLEK
ncbi:MAG: hypothetical protein FWD23_18245 [Oscillospiraceae bacterium]|nr:hypothetical protein [Oscillospiraceae bacterium]